MAAIFNSRTTCLRSLTSASRTFALPASAKTSFHAAATAQSLSLARTRRTAPQTSVIRQAASAFRNVRAPHLTRHASGGSTASAQVSGAEEALTWDRFFDLRRKRRWVNLGASVITAVASVGVIAPMLAQNDFDTWAAQISGLDSIVVLGITTFAIAGVGWLCGPAFGNTMFSVWAGRRGWGKMIAEKEKSFYARIKRYRADASASSPQNPIPDYYGEKISSVKDYRRWLKDQRAFNLKKNKNII